MVAVPAAKGAGAAHCVGREKEDTTKKKDDWLIDSILFILVVLILKVIKALKHNNMQP